METEIFGRDYVRIMSALQSVTDSTRLTVRWGGWQVTVEGLNRSRPSRREYTVEWWLEPLPENTFLLKNRVNNVLLGGCEILGPRVPPLPVQGFLTEWVGGVPFPWLARPVTTRVARAIGVRIDPEKPVWASRWKVVGHHRGQPVRVLAQDDNSPVTIPTEATPVTLDLPVEYGIWQVPADVADPRIPEWDGGALGELLRGRVEESPNSIFPTSVAGVALPFGWGAAVKMTRGEWITWLSEQGPVHFEIQDQWPEFVWVFTIRL